MNSQIKAAPERFNQLILFNPSETKPLDQSLLEESALLLTSMHKIHLSSFRSELQEFTKQFAEKAKPLSSYDKIISMAKTLMSDIIPGQDAEQATTVSQEEYDTDPIKRADKMNNNMNAVIQCFTTLINKADATFQAFPSFSLFEKSFFFGQPLTHKELKSEIKKVSNSCLEMISTLKENNPPINVSQLQIMQMCYGVNVYSALSKHEERISDLIKELGNKRVQMKFFFARFEDRYPLCESYHKNIKKIMLLYSGAHDEQSTLYCTTDVINLLGSFIIRNPMTVLEKWKILFDLK